MMNAEQRVTVDDNLKITETNSEPINSESKYTAEQHAAALRALHILDELNAIMDRVEKRNETRPPSSR